MIRSTFLLCSAALIAMIPARANIIGIGSPNVSPDVFTAVGFGSVNQVFDTGSQAFSFDGMSGHYDEGVYTATGNTFCSGCLVFVLNLSLDASQPFDLSTVRFGTWNSNTDVGYCDSSCFAGTVTPSTVFRGLGNNVGFNFSGTTFGSGADSDILIVETNATSFWVRGGIFFNDTNSNTQSSVLTGIAIPTPEPATLLLTGLALLGIGAIRRRRAS